MTLTKINVVTLHKKHWFDLGCGNEKNHVTYHLLLACCQCSYHLLQLAMVKQGASNQRCYSFAQKANDVVQVQAYLAYRGPGCSVVKACQKYGINCISFIKWKKADATVKSIQKKKRGWRGPPMVVLCWPCLVQSQVSFCIFLSTMSRAW